MSNQSLGTRPRTTLGNNPLVLLPKTLLKTTIWRSAMRWWAARPRRGRLGATQRCPESTEARPETGEMFFGFSRISRAGLRQSLV
jgi:hypothetical protein